MFWTSKQGTPPTPPPMPKVTPICSLFRQHKKTATILYRTWFTLQSPGFQPEKFHSPLYCVGRKFKLLILNFLIGRTNFILSWVEHEKKSFITSPDKCYNAKLRSSIASSISPNQTAPAGAVWSRSTMFPAK